MCLLSLRYTFAQGFLILTTMSTFREVIYMVMDELKINSDDSYFTEDHILFLIDKYRNFLIGQKYAVSQSEVPTIAYQTLCIPLIEINGEDCDGVHYLRSKHKLPNLLGIGKVHISTYDYYQNIHITYVPKERMRYVGENKYMGNIIYCSIDPENYLYLKSNNPQMFYLEFMKFTAIFNNIKDAFNLKCDEICDIMDSQIPIEDSMIPQLIEFIVKELGQSEYKPEDRNNNAQDEFNKISEK